MLSSRCLRLFLGLLNLLLVAAQVQIIYPPGRGDSVAPPFDQHIYHCAGINDASNTPRTPWPIEGGSLKITLHGDAAYIFFNIGFGSNTTDFNYTIPPSPLDETGSGTLCWPELYLPSNMPVEDETNATIQIATISHQGEGLYNCADIVFSKDATLLPFPQCFNDSTTFATPFDYSNTTVSNFTNSTSYGYFGTNVLNSTGTSTASSSSSSSSEAWRLSPSLSTLLVAGLLSSVMM